MPAIRKSTKVPTPPTRSSTRKVLKPLSFTMEQNIPKAAPKKDAPKKAAPKKAAKKNAPKSAAPKKAAAPKKTSKPTVAKSAAAKPIAPKKTTVKKTVTTTTITKTIRPSKRKMETIESAAEQPAKKRKIAVPKAKPVLNTAPTQVLDIYVFGNNEMGELGLGDITKKAVVTRPNPNAKLDAESVGVVGIDVGGMHSAVLTKDNKILTWGNNDAGALGRNTEWQAPTKDIDAEESSSDDDVDDDEAPEQNPLENIPKEIVMKDVPEGTVFTQVVAGDNATYAVTQEGLVYGWGEIRASDGPMGFTKEVKKSETAMLIPGLKNIVKLAAGNNHYLALDKKGAVFAWGAGEHNQLGRRIVERTRLNGLIPTQFGLPKAIVDIFAGSEHSFALHKNGSVYSWGANQMGQCGQYNKDGTFEDVIYNATVMQCLQGKNIKQMAGGNDFSSAVTEEGEVLVWGKARQGTTGLDLAKVSSEDIINDQFGKPAALNKPVALPFKGSFVGCGGEHGIVLGENGLNPHYAYGYNMFNQCGSSSGDEVKIAAKIDGTKIDGKKLVWASGGGQFSIIAGEHTN